jgi:hypothetical protein
MEGGGSIMAGSQRTKPRAKRGPHWKRRRAEPTPAPPERLTAPAQPWISRVRSWADDGSRILAALPAAVGVVVWASHGLERLTGVNSLGPWIDAHPLGLLLVVAAPVAASALAIGAGVLRRRRVGGRRDDGQGRALLAGSVTLSTASTIALVGVLLTIALRPAWCPEPLCSQPAGPHDEYLAADLTTLRSPSFLIAGDPAGYSLRRLPASEGPSAVPAVPTAGGESTGRPDLALVLRVQSLRASGASISIDAVWLTVQRVSPVSPPVRAWLKAALNDYASEPFLARYHGEPAGSGVPADYVGPHRAGSVSLKPLEADELSVGIESATPAAVVVRVRIDYELLDRAGSNRSLVLPYDFRMVFADPLSWQSYVLRDGRLTPG